MRNFKLTIEYDGVNFCGWQIQRKGERTVQGEIEAALLKIYKVPTKLTGSGRTDSGVHAVGQVANFKADTAMKPLEVQKALNAFLPKDIVICAVKKVGDDFHAQYSVKEKTYRYTVLNRSYRSAFLKDRCYFYPHLLNLTRLRKAAKVLVGKHDFKSFQAHDPLRAERDTVRIIKRILVRQEGDLITIEVTANGFLYKMVRNMAGTLLAIGSGQLPADAMMKILKAKNRNEAWDTAPAQGLCLMQVKY